MKTIMIVGMLCCAFIVYAIPRISCETNLLEVVFLNIGQGDATYIKTPSGADVLIDLGPANVINKALRKQSHFLNNTFDIVFITHFDSDHSGGLPVFLRNFYLTYLITGSVYEQDDALLNEVQRLDVSQKKSSYIQKSVNAGDVIVLDPHHNIYMEVLWPDKNQPPKESNDQSIVLRLVHKNNSFLFMGDVSKAIERTIFSRYPDNIQAKVIKLGHHGSNTSSAPEFIKAVAPTHGVISAGEGNSYGHPHQEVLDTLASLNIEPVQTKIEDQVFYSDGGTIWREGLDKTSFLERLVDTVFVNCSNRFCRDCHN